MCRAVTEMGWHNSYVGSVGMEGCRPFRKSRHWRQGGSVTYISDWLECTELHLECKELSLGMDEESIGSRLKRRQGQVTEGVATEERLSR